MGSADTAERTGRPTTNRTPTPRKNKNMPTRPGNPAREGNGQAAMNSNPYLNDAVQAGLNSGNRPGAGLDAFVRAASPYITGSTSPAPVAPTAPAGPFGGGGGGGGGAGSNDAARRAAAIAAVQTLFQNYNKPADAALTDNLNRITQQAQSQGDQAMTNLMQMLGSYTNPYGSGAQGAPPAGGPVFTQQPGASTIPQGQMGVTTPNPNQQRVGDGFSAEGVPAEYANQAGGQWNQMLQASYNAMNQDRMNDARMSQTSFQQALANNNAAAQFQIAQQEKQRRDQMMMSILQMAIENGLNLGELGVTF